jgi:hypothetical protein
MLDPMALAARNPLVDLAKVEEVRRLYRALHPNLRRQRDPVPSFGRPFTRRPLEPEVVEHIVGADVPPAATPRTR